MAHSPTPEQIKLLRDIRMQGAINGLLFSDHRSAGPSLRLMGLIAGVGDACGISAAGFEALANADASLAHKGNGNG